MAKSINNYLASVVGEKHQQRHKEIHIILICLICNLTFGQDTAKTVYTGLETKTFYAVRQLRGGTPNGNGRFEVNGRRISKSTYDKYLLGWENMKTCCPCILRTYNEYDVLLQEAVSCTDCRVGSFKEFYPNGIVKWSGQYKENPTGNWDGICNRGYCSIRVGQWIHFNEKGDTLYSEFWKDGQFVKQIPEQDKSELWKIEVTINGEMVDKKILTPRQVNEIKIIPKFKNSSTAGANITILFQVSAVGHKQVEQTISLDDFKTIDVQKMLDEAEIKSLEPATCTMYILNNGDTAFNCLLTVKR